MPRPPSSFKDAVLKEIEVLKSTIINISDTIHSHAELGMKEFKSSRLLADQLEQNGFELQRGIAGMETAFKASQHGRHGPSVGFLAEYDALPGLGHACGHNIIGTSAAFAAIAVAKVTGELNGTVSVLGTPDEEGDGGKIPMLQAGTFRDIDVAITIHPSGKNAGWWPTVALGGVTLEFEGRGAHYATPQKGANTLDAAIAVLSTVNVLRHGFRPDVLIGYILGDGGVTPIIVPDRTTLRITVKAVDADYLNEVSEKIEICAEGIAKSIGAKVKMGGWHAKNLCYEESIPNLTLIQAANENFKLLKLETEDPLETIRGRSFFSTDYGNVSRKLPGVNIAIAVGKQPLGLHTPEFARATGSEEGHEAVMVATKVMAMTAIDLMADPTLMQKAQQEFERYKSSSFRDIPLLPRF